MEKRCPQCSGPMELREGYLGSFWGCKSFPYCKGTISAKGTYMRKFTPLKRHAMIPTYTASFVLEPNELFAHLLALEWLDVTEARREYFMSDMPRSYVYGKGVGEREYHSKEYTQPVLDVLAMLNYENKASYNVCFLNRYDHQKHQLGWHADDSPTMDKTHPIAVISLGAEREIWWKLQTAKGTVPADCRRLLQHGSLFVMPAGFQELYFHRIPKCDRPCETRISLTFRRYT